VKCLNDILEGPTVTVVASLLKTPTVQK